MGTFAAPLLLAAACSGSGTGGGGPGPTSSLNASKVALVSSNDCDAVLGRLRAAAEKQVGPYGFGSGVRLDRLESAPDGAVRAQGAVPGPSDGSAAPKQPGYSRTNAHEAAADEPDLVKTDGRRIVTVQRGRLIVIDPATRRVVHRLDLGHGEWGAPSTKLLLSGNRVLVLAPSAGALPPRLPGQEAKPLDQRPTTRLTLVGLAGAPKILGSWETLAGYMDARQTGSVARVVVTSTPRINFPALPRGPKGEREALERNRRIVRSAPLDAWLPAFQVRDPAGRAIGTYKTPCGHISHPREGAGLSMLSVLTIDLAKAPGDPAPVSVAADGQNVYGNGNNLYVTSSAVPRNGPDRRQWVLPQATQIHKFRLDQGQRPRYVASGSVRGQLLNQYSMSEHGGRLRVATTTFPSGPVLTPQDDPRPTPTARSQSTVYVLAERDGRLDEIGRIGGLGKGEWIYSVRFIGTTGYVVTFRQVDPLYVVDLKDPSRPRLTGELKITGYSAYLHPTGGGRLLGVGQEADLDGRVQGMQVSLFDVSGAPRRISGYHLPEAGSVAEFEPHAFLYWPQTGLTVLPIISRHPNSGSTGPSGPTAVVLRVSGDSVRRVGTVEHPDGEYGSVPGIQRSLVVGDTLWTISDSGARATGITALDDRGWVAF